VELQARHWLLALAFAFVSHAGLLFIAQRPAVYGPVVGPTMVEISLEPSAWGRDQAVLQPLSDAGLIEATEAPPARVEAEVQARVRTVAQELAPVVQASVETSAVLGQIEVAPAELPEVTEVSAVPSGEGLEPVERVIVPETIRAARELGPTPTVSAAPEVKLAAEATPQEAAGVRPVSVFDEVTAEVESIADRLSAVPLAGPMETLPIPAAVPTVADEAPAEVGVEPVAQTPLVADELPEAPAVHDTDTPLAVLEPAGTRQPSVAVTEVGDEMPSESTTPVVPRAAAIETSAAQAGAAVPVPQVGEEIGAIQGRSVEVASPSVSVIQSSGLLLEEALIVESLPELTGTEPRLADTSLGPGSVAQARLVQRHAAPAEAVGEIPEVEASDEMRPVKPLGIAETVEAQAVEYPEKTLLARLEPTPRLGTSPYGTLGRRLVRAGQLTEGKRLLQRARRHEPGHPDLTAVGRALEKRKARALAAYRQHLRALASGKLDKAERSLDQAQALWTDSPDLAHARQRLEERKLAAARPVPTPIPRQHCRSNYAGYGKLSRATCYDTLSQGELGPLLVVVPAGDGLSRPYAIGKHEVSVADYNRYCRLSGRCQEITDRHDQLPATQVTLEQAQAYARWLSEKTGYTYRLPTDREWLHAASAAGAQPRQDFNCMARLGRQVFKGSGLINVRAGEANGWGLLNYVGNAQEWVVTPSGIPAVRGGAFRDTLSRCHIGLIRTHDGRADDMTGFRLVRELAPSS